MFFLFFLEKNLDANAFNLIFFYISIATTEVYQLQSCLHLFFQNYFHSGLPFFHPVCLLSCFYGQLSYLSTMGKRYYCDYCDRSFQDNMHNRKKHLNGVQHHRAKKAWFDQFRGETGTNSGLLIVWSSFSSRYLLFKDS